METVAHSSNSTKHAVVTRDQLLQDLSRNAKYKVLIRSLVALSVALLVVIFVNFELARRITTDTEHMDTIGEISDVMFQIAADAQQLSLVDGTDNEQVNALVTQLKQETQEVDDYLVTLKDYTQQDAPMAEFANNWQQYRTQLVALKLQKFGEIGDLSQRNELAKYAYRQKQPLYDLLSDSYDIYLEKTYRYGRYVRILQILTLVGLIGFLLYFVNYTFRRMRLADADVQRAQQQTQEIMATVNEGLFLIDKNLIIDEQYSAKLEDLLHQKNIAGRSLLDVLRGMISPADMETTQLFVEQLYNNWVVEELIQDLNPLKQVLVSYIDDKSISDTKFLSFNFLRVTDDNNNVVKVFVSVVDVTNEIRLQKQMQQDQEQHDRQIQMISYLLSVEPTQIGQFIEQSRQRIERMNNVLKMDNQDYAAKASQLFRDMHSLKGDASAIKLDAVVNIAQREEAELKKIQQSTQVRGNDFLSFTIGLNQLLEMLDFIETLMQKLNFTAFTAQPTTVNQSPALNTTENGSEITPSSASLNVTSNQQVEGTQAHSPVVGKPQNRDNTLPTPPYWQTLFDQYAQDIAKRHDKSVLLEVTGFDQSSVSDTEMAMYKDISIQLLKNAIVHGIESPNHRLALNKAATGHIKLSLTEQDNQRTLTIHDDGQGIDWQTIKQKAVELGKITTEQAHHLQPKQLVGLLFSPGLSTADKLDEDAGQGVGMDIVRQLAIEGHGHLHLNSKPNQFTEFVLRFPKP